MCRVDGTPSARCRDRFPSRSSVTPSRSSRSGSETAASTQTCSQRAHLEDGKLQLVYRLITAVWTDLFVGGCNKVGLLLHVINRRRKEKQECKGAMDR